MEKKERVDLILQDTSYARKIITLRHGTEGWRLALEDTKSSDRIYELLLQWRDQDRDPGADAVAAVLKAMEERVEVAKDGCEYAAIQASEAESRLSEAQAGLEAIKSWLAAQEEDQ